MILLAKMIAPMDRPPFVDGGVAIRQGRIAQVGPRRDLPSDPTIDLGDVVLLPGLINAHAHLELSTYAGQLPPSSLWTWLARLMLLRRRGNPQDERAGAAPAAAEALRAGTTCIADISRRGDAWRAMREVPIRKVCFAELISVAAEPPRDPEELAQAIDAVQQDDLLTVGVSPHAPYTVLSRHIVAAVELARDRKVPITTHLAETVQEYDWLKHGSGMLGTIIRGFSASEPIQSPRCSPIEYAERLGLLSAGALLAHVNYITDRELERLRQYTASIVYCPRSHHFFGHKPHRWRDMLDAGINVCVGTDSAASLPAGSKVSVLDELRFLHRQHPDVPSQTLFSMATIRAARALGLGDQLGSITPGKYADLVALPLTSRDEDSTLGNILKTPSNPIGVWIGGKRYDS
jgi:cytosine/adenosine deaminase-related metal-dependent hydrolase